MTPTDAKIADFNSDLFLEMDQLLRANLRSRIYDGLLSMIAADGLASRPAASQTAIIGRVVNTLPTCRLGPIE